ncbi:MAG: hypothetical protein QM778_27810 [Myxococcales bacterium]
MSDRSFKPGDGVCCFRGMPTEFKGTVRRRVSRPPIDGYWVRVAAEDLSSIDDVFVSAAHADQIRPTDWPPEDDD